MDRDGSAIGSAAKIMGGVAGRVIVIVLLAFAAYMAVNFSFRAGFTMFCADTVDEPPGRDVEITVAKGETIDELAERLYADNIIPSELAFRVQARLYNIGFYPGTYRLNTSMSTKEILKSIDLTEAEYEDRLAAEAAASEDGAALGSGDEGDDGQ